jgi:hypothetical protein
MPDPKHLALDLSLAVSSGIPEAYTATVNAIVKARETMDPDIRRREDMLLLALKEWFWYDLCGLPKPEGLVKP